MRNWFRSKGKRSAKKKTGEGKNKRKPEEAEGKESYGLTTRDYYRGLRPEWGFSWGKMVRESDGGKENANQGNTWTPPETLQKAAPKNSPKKKTEGNLTSVTWKTRQLLETNKKSLKSSERGRLRGKKKIQKRLNPRGRLAKRTSSEKLTKKLQENPRKRNISHG